MMYLSIPTTFLAKIEEILFVLDADKPASREPRLLIGQNADADNISVVSMTMLNQPVTNKR